ncbi:MAG TPA: erythromycin esterase family protein [Myxococcaceae bacterium]|jgi:erythromycin esterase-like protein
MTNRGRAGAWAVVFSIFLSACGAEQGFTRAAPPTDAELEALRHAALPFETDPARETQLGADLASVDVVLLGEDTHGTREFYELRSRITQYLIAEHGFTAVLIEGDWPEASPVNAYVRGESTGEDPLAGFASFPNWMWRNAEIRGLVDWMREHNAQAPSEVGFYGLDLQNLDAALTRAVAYLEGRSAEAGERARGFQACFLRAGRGGEFYGPEAARGAVVCTNEAASLLAEVEAHRADAEQRGEAALAEWFDARESARAVKNGEHYYRGMYQGENSWNIRDRHMLETLQSVAEHHGRNGQRARVIVWAHNTHVGDARATSMSIQGDLNLGELVRTQWNRSTFLLGFTTYEGTVTAADRWGGAPENKPLAPAVEGSYEHLFHQLGLPRFAVRLRDNAPEVLQGPRPERAVGVVFDPGQERAGNYIDARMVEQFDAVIHVDRSTRVLPLGP